MLNIAKRFFDKITSDQNDAAGQNRVHDVRVATCALLVEMAQIDESFSDEETQTILKILKETYGLSKEHADALIEAAQRELEESVDYWQFAGLINKNYSIEEKIEIVETLWRIVFVDGKMDQYEHYLMNKLGKLLRLTHTQLIDAKLKVLHPDIQ